MTLSGVRLVTTVSTVSPRTLTTPETHSPTPAMLSDTRSIDTTDTTSLTAEIYRVN